ncbi:hypothetical protein RFI_06710 [Reticulomyxa filosa]|uniref:Uncharacterized protein n=1 Tax=Reticulomyxa filosa TaxID=46433 RepID=X6NYR9_RETFI|nr:hypothetical protein RFI_06710 [Reticulomyxa filosa]|eukprot:ETO30412.1 hypothetical protein RFI_06710 [Reticulomyxa filosa]
MTSNTAKRRRTGNCSEMNGTCLVMNVSMNINKNSPLLHQSTANRHKKSANKEGNGLVKKEEDTITTNSSFMSNCTLSTATTTTTTTTTALGPNEDLPPLETIQSSTTPPTPMSASTSTSTSTATSTPTPTLTPTLTPVPILTTTPTPQMATEWNDFASVSCFCLGIDQRYRVRYQSKDRQPPWKHKGKDKEKHKAVNPTIARSDLHFQSSTDNHHDIHYETPLFNITLQHCIGNGIVLCCNQYLLRHAEHTIDGNNLSQKL